MSSTAVARTIGAAFGLVFVLVNSGVVASPGSWVLRALGVVALVAVMVRAWGRHDVPVQPRPAALGVYWASVAVEAVALVAGGRLLADLDRAAYGVAWVAFIVGFHFLPFAWAFRTPSFLPLGLLLMTLGVVGAGLGVAGAGDRAIALSAGVGSGFALLGWAGLPAPGPTASR
jgi:hypothetical protein